MDGPFLLGERVKKKSGSAWQGKIVGWYSTQLTPQGYAVESEFHPGSVQIYPASALERVAAWEGDAMTVDPFETKEKLMRLLEGLECPAEFWAGMSADKLFFLGKAIAAQAKASPPVLPPEEIAKKIAGLDK